MLRGSIYVFIRNKSSSEGWLILMKRNEYKKNQTNKIEWRGIKKYLLRFIWLIRNLWLIGRRVKERILNETDYKSMSIGITFNWST